MTQPIPTEQKEKLQALLKEIAKVFQVPYISLIVRSGGNAKGTLVFTNDNPSLAFEALREHMVAEARKFAETGEQIAHEKHLRP